MTSSEPSVTSAPVAIAHDYITQRGGAERVVLALHRMFPEAPIYTLFYNPEGTFPEFRDANIITSPLNKIPALREDPRLALPLLPFAASLMKVPESQAIVSSSGWAHGFRYQGRTLVYCHTPARWVYLTDEYVGTQWWKSPQGIAATALRPFLRKWDQHAAKASHRYVGNSTIVQERIRRVYGRSDVGLIFPPHSVDTSKDIEPIPDASHMVDEVGYLLVVSRLMPYKNVDAVIKAAQLSGKRLLVIGRGPEEANLRAIAGPEVVFAQDVSEAQLRWAYKHATALVAVSHEDFGITPLEASAWGIPTIALRAGGYLDTIEESINGLFVEEIIPERISEKIHEMSCIEWNSGRIKEHVTEFSEDRFMQTLTAHLSKL